MLGFTEADSSKETDATWISTTSCLIVLRASDLHLHLVIWQTLLSKATYNWGKHKAIHHEEAIRQREMLVTPSLSHCSNKYKLVREGEEDKRGKKGFFKKKL